MAPNKTQRPPNKPIKAKSAPASPLKEPIKKIAGSPKKSPSPIMEIVITSPSSLESSSPTTSSPKIENIKYSYKQTKQFCDILEKKLNIKFWICLTKEQQEEEREDPTDTEYYRLGYCVYNGIKLVNIMRYFQDRSKQVKLKSYATINLAHMRATNMSTHKPVFSPEETENIRRILG